MANPKKQKLEKPAAGKLHWVEGPPEGFTQMPNVTLPEYPDDLEAKLEPRVPPKSP